MGKIRRLFAAGALVAGVVAPLAAATPAEALTASGNYIALYCPNGYAPNGVWVSTPYSSDNQFAHFFGAEDGATVWGFGTHHNPETVTLTIGCGGNPWRYQARLWVDSSEATQYSYVDCRYWGYNCQTSIWT